jgi:hypothetical protein
MIARTAAIPITEPAEDGFFVGFGVLTVGFGALTIGCGALTVAIPSP